MLRLAAARHIRTGLVCAMLLAGALDWSRAPAVSRGLSTETDARSRPPIPQGVQGYPPEIAPALGRGAPALRGWRQRGEKPALYVANLTSNAVDIYGVDHRLIGSITGLNGPQGLAVDAVGNLYVANTLGHNVLVFRPGATTPSLTLNDDGFYPFSVAVGTDGEVYVSNICSGHGGLCAGNGSILGYAKGATRSNRRYNNEGLLRPYFIAVDAKGRVYVDGFTMQNGIPTGGFTLVGVYASGTAHLTNLGIRSGFIGGLAIDNRGNLAFDDQRGKGGSRLDIYPPGSSKPKRSFLLARHAGDDVLTFAFTPSKTALWTADATAGQCSEFSYPVGDLRATIEVHGTVSAVATAPEGMQ
jgi:DNA-binding beta-propeller fold protein YncE